MFSGIPCTAQLGTAALSQLSELQCGKATTKQLTISESSQDKWIKSGLDTRDLRTCLNTDFSSPTLSCLIWRDWNQDPSLVMRWASEVRARLLSISINWHDTNHIFSPMSTMHQSMLWFPASLLEESLHELPVWKDWARRPRPNWSREIFCRKNIWQVSSSSYSNKFPNLYTSVSINWIVINVYCV